MSKSVSFARPPRAVQPGADAWVSGAGEEVIVPAKPPEVPIPMKRLTLDIPEELMRHQGREDCRGCPALPGC
jgi:hypothetical protein